MIFTIEGSNADDPSNQYGLSWTLIYDGSTGLDVNPGRNAYGALQLIPNVSVPFKSYRYLVKAVRAIPTCSSYTELVMLIY